MRDDLQELVDDVSRLLGRPGDARGRRVHAARLLRPRRQPRPSAMDAVRTRSILTRGSPAADPRLVRGVRHRRRPRARCARRPTRPPGSSPGWCIPVRHAGRTRGYLWLLDGGRIDPADADDPALAAAVDLAAEAGRLLAERDAADEDLGRPLATALTGSATAAGQAARTLAAASARTPRRSWSRWRPGPPGCRTGGGSRPPAPSPPRWRTAGRSPSSCRWPTPGDLRPPARSPPPPSPASRRAAPPGCPRCAGASAELPDQWREARAAARVAAAVAAPLPRRALGRTRRLAGWSPNWPGPTPPSSPAGRPRARRDRRGRSSTARAAPPAPRQRCRSTGRRCTTGWPGSRSSPASTSPTARPGCCCTPRSRRPACALPAAARSTVA